MPGTAIENQLLDVPDSVEKAERAKSSSAAELPPPSESGPRQYLGYIVRVYYIDQLQDVRANPTRLLKSFPAALYCSAAVRMQTSPAERNCAGGAEDSPSIVGPHPGRERTACSSR